jgi:hypothetical protein
LIRNADVAAAAALRPVIFRALATAASILSFFRDPRRLQISPPRRDSPDKGESACGREEGPGE